MSFASPLWLLALAAVPVALAAYVQARRRAKRYAIRFPALSTLRGAVEAGPSWERHLPAASVMAAIAVLGLALARPRVTYHAPVNQASIVLVLDHSGSMAADDVQPNRITAAIKAANTFIGKLPSTAKVGAVGFGTTPDLVQAPVTNHAAARALIDSETANGGTDTGDALNVALRLLDASNRKHPPAAIVLLSDGAANAGPNPAAVATQARRDKIPIYTVALGTASGVLPNPDPLAPPQAVPPDPQLMQQIATNSGGRSFNAHSADQLSSIYQHLGTQLGSVDRKRDITFVFAIAGVVLLALAAAGSVLWSGRLP